MSCGEWRWVVVMLATMVTVVAMVTNVTVMAMVTVATSSDGGDHHDEDLYHHDAD